MRNIDEQGPWFRYTRQERRYQAGIGKHQWLREKLKKEVIPSVGRTVAQIESEFGQWVKDENLTGQLVDIVALKRLHERRFEMQQLLRPFYEKKDFRILR